MELYLVQHGQAKSEVEDPERPLTDLGREEVERVGAFAARAGVKVRQIRHSGKRRAEETALILGRHLSAPDGAVGVAGLAPKDDPRPVARGLRSETQPLMLVSHLPLLDRLAGLLIAGDAERSVVQFRQGGMVCLTAEGTRWAVAWAVTPECLV